MLLVLSGKNVSFQEYKPREISVIGSEFQYVCTYVRTVVWFNLFLRDSENDEYDDVLLLVFEGVNSFICC